MLGFTADAWTLTWETLLRPTESLSRPNLSTFEADSPAGKPLPIHEQEQHYRTKLLQIEHLVLNLRWKVDAEFNLKKFHEFPWKKQIDFQEKTESLKRGSFKTNEVYSLINCRITGLGFALRDKIQPATGKYVPGMQIQCGSVI